MENKKTLKFILSALIIISPILIVLVDCLLLKTNVFLKGASNPDEFMYLRELRGLFQYSIGGTCIYENASSAWFDLGFHGVQPLISWFSVYFFPNTDNIIILTNICWLILAYCLYLILVKPDYKELIAVLIVAYLSPYLYLYLSTSLGTVVDISLVLIWVSLYRNWVKKSNPLKLTLLIILGIVLGLYKIPLILITLFLPCSLAGNKINKKLFINLLIWVVGVLFIFIIFSKLPAPFLQINSINKLLNGDISSLFSNFLNNLSNSVHIYDTCSFVARLISYLVCIVLLIMGIKEYKELKTINYTLILGVVYFCFICLNFFFYQVVDTRDTRLYLPLLFISSIHICQKNLKVVLCTSILLLVLTFCISKDFYFSREMTEYSYDTKCETVVYKSKNFKNNNIVEMEISDEAGVIDSIIPLNKKIQFLITKYKGRSTYILDEDLKNTIDYNPDYILITPNLKGNFNESLLLENYSNEGYIEDNPDFKTNNSK